MRPDAIPIKPVHSYVVLGSEGVETLFGAAYQLRGNERVELVHRGIAKGLADVLAGENAGLFLGGTDRANLLSGNPKLRGPKGLLTAPSPLPIPSLLMLPQGLISAWNLKVGQQTSVALGEIAVRVTVALGPSPCISLDHSLPLMGGLNSESTAEWIPTVEWNSRMEQTAATQADEPALSKVITENDVRRARMLRKRVRLSPGQIITPAARTLAVELGILD